MPPKGRSLLTQSPPGVESEFIPKGDHYSHVFTVQQLMHVHESAEQGNVSKLRKYLTQINANTGVDYLHSSNTTLPQPSDPFTST